VLDTALRQLRYGWAVSTGRRIRVRDVRGLVDDLLATREAFGDAGGEEIRELLGAAVDPEARQVIDARRWRITVRKAYQETSYYRQAFNQLGLTPDALTLDCVGELPPTPKAAVRGLPEAFISARATPVVQAWTTGTTGTPTALWFSRYEVELAAALGAVAFMVNTGIGPTDVFQIAVSSRAVLGVHNTMQACWMIGAACFLTGIVDPAEAINRLATPVHLPGKKPKVSVMSVLPSYLGELVQAAERLGYGPDDFGLERIISSGEVLSDALRRRAEATFGASMVDNYAMTETFPVGGLACSQDHLHLAADQGLVEVLDPSSAAPTEPGQVGMLVVTPWFPYRDTTLVLRLATGDLVRRLDHEPSCELARLPATSRLLGRAAWPPARDGRPLFQRDLLDLLEAEPAVPLPARYAVEPAGDGFDLHLLVASDDAALRSRLEDRAAERSLPLRKLTVHTDLADMPPTQFVRALLRETVIMREEGSSAWSLR
jgi:phenylacetate-CoA ligase